MSDEGTKVDRFEELAETLADYARGKKDLQTLKVTLVRSMKQ